MCNGGVDVGHTIWGCPLAPRRGHSSGGCWAPSTAPTRNKDARLDLSPERVPERVPWPLWGGPLWFHARSGWLKHGTAWHSPRWPGQWLGLPGVAGQAPPGPWGFVQCWGGDPARPPPCPGGESACLVSPASPRAALAKPSTQTGGAGRYEGMRLRQCFKPPPFF